MKRLALAIAACVAFAFAAASGAQPAPERPSVWVGKKPVFARRFIAATANPIATGAAYRMLAAGGSAVDAAIAAQLVLNLVEPQSSGIGGGGFMLVHDAKRKRLVAYDGRETAPAAARSDRFLDASGRPIAFVEAVVGGRSVGVPGTVALLAEAHRRHGRLPWASLFAPAIALAESGFAVSPRLHALLAQETRWLQPRARSYFFDADGKPWPVGHVLRNPAFARTLRTIADRGAAAFYAGDIARDVVATADSHATNPGDLAPGDLARYRVEVREPVCGAYRSYRVCGMPPPSSGGIASLQMLAILERYDLASIAPASFFAVHLMSEAGRLAYADRDAYVADPAFVDVPSGLLDRGYLAHRASLVRVDASLGRAPPGTPGERVSYGEHAALELPSTSHLSIVDAHGNAVAMTTTVEDAFGSRLMTEGGFLLNNELTDFSFVPIADGKPVANRVEPGKRPRSSMSPTMVYDRRGDLRIVAGSAGGPMIVNYTVKTLIGIVDWKLDAQTAIALPNFGSRNGPTQLEKGTPVAALAAKLEAIGHRIAIVDETSGTQALVRTRDGWIGGADPRREGSARGE